MTDERKRTIEWLLLGGAVTAGTGAIVALVVLLWLWRG